MSIERIVHSSMSETMCPSLSSLVKVWSTSSLYGNDKNLRNLLGDANLSHLMKIGIESPQTLS